MSKRNRYSKALKHLKSTQIEEKIKCLDEALPTNHTKGLYSLNATGYQLGDPPPQEVFYPDEDGNWSSGVPGVAGESSYTRAPGFWTGGSNWDTTYVANMGQDEIGEDGKNTAGLIAADGTVKTSLPEDSRSFILGPLVDGFTLDHTSDAYTNIGYLQKDTRQFVLLGRIEGQWKAGLEHESVAVWDGTATGFTSYNENFTLAMAQWFRTRILAKDYASNVPYFYSGGVPQGDNDDCPNCPDGMKGGNGVGGGGGGASSSGVGGGGGWGSGGDPDEGTPGQPGGPNEGDAEDAGYPSWGPMGGLGDGIKDFIDNIFGPGTSDGIGDLIDGLTGGGDGDGDDDGGVGDFIGGVTDAFGDGIVGALAGALGSMTGGTGTGGTGTGDSGGTGTGGTGGGAGRGGYGGSAPPPPPSEPETKKDTTKQPEAPESLPGGDLAPILGGLKILNSALTKVTNVTNPVKDVLGSIMPSKIIADTLTDRAIGGSTSSSYNGQLGMQLLNSVITGNNGQIKLSKQGVKNMFDSIDPSKISDAITLGPKPNPDAKNAIKPGQKVGNILTKGWGDQGGSEFNYDKKTGLVTITSNKMLRSSEFDKKDDSGKVVEFEDIPTPTTDQIWQHIPKNVLKTFYNTVANAEIGSSTDSQKFKPFAAGKDPKVAAGEMLDAFPEITKALYNFTVHGTASNAVWLRQKMVDAGISPQSESEKQGEGFGGHVYSQESMPLSELKPEVQAAIKNKLGIKESFSFGRLRKVQFIIETASVAPTSTTSTPTDTSTSTELSSSDLKPIADNIAGEIVDKKGTEVAKKVEDGLKDYAKENDIPLEQQGHDEIANTINALTMDEIYAQDGIFHKTIDKYWGEGSSAKDPLLRSVWEQEYNKPGSVKQKIDDVMKPWYDRWKELYNEWHAMVKRSTFSSARLDAIKKEYYPLVKKMSNYRERHEYIWDNMIRSVLTRFYQGKGVGLPQDLPQDKGELSDTDYASAAAATAERKKKKKSTMDIRIAGRNTDGRRTGSYSNKPSSAEIDSKNMKYDPHMKMWVPNIPKAQQNNKGDTQIAAYYGGEDQRKLDQNYKKMGWPPGKALPKNWGNNPKPGFGGRDTWHPGKDQVKNKKNKKNKNTTIPSYDVAHYEPKGRVITESSFTPRQRKILREIKKPIEIKEAPKKYKMNFAGKYSSQNTPDKTASTVSDALVASGNAKGQKWRVEDNYWSGYETTEKMNIIYDRVGHGQQAWDKIIAEASRKNGWRTREIQEQLNIRAHEKAMLKENPDYQSPWGIQIIETTDENVKNFDRVNKIKQVLSKDLKAYNRTYKKKDVAPEYPDEAPPEMINGYHPKLVKGQEISNRFNKLDPQSAKAMPKTGNPHIDAKVEKAKNNPDKDGPAYRQGVFDKIKKARG